MFPLQEEPVEPLGAACKLKLFHDDEVERDEYAEAYLNLDLPEGRVGLDEKEPRRSPLLGQGLVGGHVALVPDHARNRAQGGRWQGSRPTGEGWEEVAWEQVSGRFGPS